MLCDDANTFIEAAVAGEAVPDGIRAHMADCPRCAARLARARQIEHALSQRPVLTPPPMFTTAVMARLRRERWRVEQVVDISFNLALVCGVLLIVAGVAGFAWRAGAFELGREVASVVFDLTRQATARAVADAQVITIGLVLLSTAFALWWWAEEDIEIW